jgi:hypothetical protein
MTLRFDLFDGSPLPCIFFKRILCL